MSKLPDFLFQGPQIAATLHLYRNLSLYKFPGKMTSAEMTGSLKTIVESLKQIPALQPLLFFPAEDLSPLDKELLFEHFQCAESSHEGQGFACNPSCLLTFHDKDHVQLHFVVTDDDLVRAFSTLSQIDDPLGKAHPYAFSSRFGYLTSNPLLCGSALEARVYLHVPALRHTGLLGELISKYGDEQIVFQGLEGSMDDLVGDVLVLKNHYTLGVSEETFLSLLQTTAQKFVAAEKKAREDLKSKPDLKDFVGRSFGLIMHSYQLHPKEALDGLSGLKLGVDLGWVSGITSQQLSTLMLQQRRGHLTHLLNLPSSTPQELSHKRAEWLHQELKKIAIAE